MTYRSLEARSGIFINLERQLPLNLQKKNHNDNVKTFVVIIQRTKIMHQIAK